MLSVGWWIGGFVMGMAIVEEDPKPACKFGNTMVAQPLQCPCSACIVVRELEKERDHYRMAAEAEAKRGDELAAMVNGLERTLEYCIALPESRSDEMTGVMREAIKETRKSSLILHDADLMKTLSDKFNDMGAEPHVYGKEMTHGEIGDYFEAQSDKLRKQAEDQESKS
jgi:hypothetical protein